MADKFEGQIPDLYDWEVKHIQQTIYPEMARKFFAKQANESTLEDLRKWAEEEFFKIGLVVTVDTAAAYLNCGPPEITVQARVPGHSDSKYGHDHSRHRQEVLEANNRGERYLGEKGN